MYFYACLTWSIVDANKCASKPCQNGAFCIDGIGSYQCVCTNGFHGQNCDKSKYGVLFVDKLKYFNTLFIILDHLISSVSIVYMEYSKIL